MPPVRTSSSVNVHDSIANGVSLYMAQLRRLQQIVQAADHATPGEPVLYLLDEILSGTNSQDRTAGVRAIIHHLTKTTSFGVLATHDLALVEDEEIQRAATFVHFVDTFDAQAGKMSFDYRMRPGPVERSNALELMRMMGLPVD
jgi:DNA mismatch repair ATPase MutS